VQIDRELAPGDHCGDSGSIEGTRRASGFG
jgi:hypothetical protein